MAIGRWTMILEIENVTRVTGTSSGGIQLEYVCKITDNTFDKSIQKMLYTACLMPHACARRVLLIRYDRDRKELGFQAVDWLRAPQAGDKVLVGVP